MEIKGKRVITSRSLVIRTLLLFLAIGLMGQSAFAQDPGESGPFAVSEDTYGGLGGFPLSGTSLAIDDSAVVYYPSELPQGPLPLVVFMHGWYATCLSGTSTSYEWPCSMGWSPIDSFRGFAYVANALASHGYIVVSINGNDINAHPQAANAAPINARAQLIQHHLDKWNTFNTVGGSPFGQKFRGKVDLSRVGIVGHSRGGEGAATQVVYNRSLGSPYGVRAVLLLAPTNSVRALVDNVSLGVVLPYCDGDVVTLEGVHYYDDARYSFQDDDFAKHAFWVMGSGHNEYNERWLPGTSQCYESDRISSIEQRRAGITLITAFFRTYIGGEKQFLALLSGDLKPMPSATTATIHVSYHPPTDKRLDINRLDSYERAFTNTLGGGESASGLITRDLCGYDGSHAQCLPSTQILYHDPIDDTEYLSPLNPYDAVDMRQPHTYATSLSTKLGLSQLLLQWANTGAWYENQLPVSHRDLREYDVLQFRAGVDFLNSPSNVQQDFSVELIDGGGFHRSVLVSNNSDALAYPPGGIPAGGLEYGALVMPKLFLNTVRIPLLKFSGVDLSNIVAIRLVFDQTSQGAVSVSDIALAKDERLRALKVVSLIPLLASEQ